MIDNDVILKMKDLRTYFHTDAGIVKAVDGVSFELTKGKTLGIVGESGCGKSVTVQSIMQLVSSPPGKIEGGQIIYRRPDGESIDIASLAPNGKDMQSIRGKEIAMIFQEPMSSLNPVYTIGTQITELINRHLKLGKRGARGLAVEMLSKVGIPAPEQRVDSFPHELSGGMRQRAMIAMALSCSPKILIADEPTTALDVTVEAQILKLLADLQSEFGMSIIFITHDLGVIGEMAEEVLVMYAGQVIEKTDIDSLFYEPLHPYTKGLLESRPRMGSKQRLVPIKGNVPDVLELPRGCHFAPRCVQKMAICEEKSPENHVVKPGRFARCWLYADEGGGTA